jgi:hypothetical protein
MNTNIVADVLLAHIPRDRKTTQSGWVSFNAPCCVYNGESRDERQRGGIIVEDPVVSYHCFNCGFTTAWQPGRHLSFKMRNLLSWLGVSDSDINRLVLAVLKENDGIEAGHFHVEIPEFSTTPLPDGAQPFLSYETAGTHLSKVIEYTRARNYSLDDYNFYWSPELQYRDRLIVPFYYEKRIVGWTARSIRPNAKPKYISSQQPGYVFNLDAQHYKKLFTIVVEGPLDAIHIDGVAILKNEFSDQQIKLLNRLGKDIIVVPDRDSAGKSMMEQSLELGYSVSLPDWDQDVKDIGDAVARYGKIYTLYSIVSSAEKSKIKNQLKAKKWFKKY